MRKLLLLRPEPGLSASAERARSMGLEVLTCPLFRIEPVAWRMPEPGDYDALLLTSVNAVRHGGAQLAALRSLPVHAVGAATAEAARGAGFTVATIGEADVDDLLAQIPAAERLLHLAGEDHRLPGRDRLDRRIVYRAAQFDKPDLPDLTNLVAAVHSPRAGRRLDELTDAREQTAIAAISAAAAEAAGRGWEKIEIAERPTDASLLALAAMLCHTSPPR